MSGSTASRQDPELHELRRELGQLRAENARLARLVGLIGPRPLPDEAARSPLFGGLPGAVDHSSTKADKVTFFRHLFAGRDDVHALRWENDRTGRAGWMPAVEGGFRRGQTNRTYLPLTDEIITAHLAGTIHAGLYPLMNGDTCRLLACDFDGPLALLDALAFTKAARSFDVPTALEVSRSGSGAHVWMFFAGAVAAATARRVGTGLVREAMAIRGELDLASYDRLFPAQDFLPGSGSIGNLIALPLQGKCRSQGTTVFLDLATLEPHEDQFGYLSHVERLTQKQVADRAEAMRPLTVGPAARRLHASGATRMHPPAPAVIRARLGAGISLERAGLLRPFSGRSSMRRRCTIPSSTNARSGDCPRMAFPASSAATTRTWSGCTCLAASRRSSRIWSRRPVVGWRSPTTGQSRRAMTSHSTRSFSPLSNVLLTPSSNMNWECWRPHRGRERRSSAAR